jgi:hypothetical protein
MLNLVERWRRNSSASGQRCLTRGGMIMDFMVHNNRCPWWPACHVMLSLGCGMLCIAALVQPTDSRAMQHVYKKKCLAAKIASLQMHPSFLLDNPSAGGQ